MDHMNSTRWRTSSYSGGNGGECVQVAATPSARRVLVRDSKNPDGPMLRIGPSDWRRFTDHFKPRKGYNLAFTARCGTGPYEGFGLGTYLESGLAEC